MARVDNVVFYKEDIEVLVMEGDVLGLYTPPNANPISVVYTQHSAQDKILFMDGVSSPLCRLSLCNSSMSAMTGFYPSIGETLSNS